MKTHALIGIMIFALLFTYTLISEVLFDECGLSKIQAKNRVLQELTRRHLDARHLFGPENQKGSCWYSFYYENEEQNLNYVVTSTWLHGVKLNVWDYNQEKREFSVSSRLTSSPP